MLQVGDTIKCSTSDEMIYLMNQLAKENIETDFLYEKDGERGLWLEIIKVGKGIDEYSNRIYSRCIS